LNQNAGLSVPTPQAPISSGFTAASTASDVMHGIDLAGKVAIVTGGYSGLGRETVRVFVASGARVIVPSRDTDRAQAALKGMVGAEIVPMDLADSSSIDTFAKRFLETGLPLHILVNSAGIMALPELTLDAQGHELQFATNHLGHFHLTLRLWPALVRAEGARVVSVSSMGHRFSPVVFDDIDFEHRPYDPFLAYGQSKTANILFAVQLDTHGQEKEVRAFAVHPGGVVDTGLGKHVPVDALKAAGALDADGNPIIDPARGRKTVEQGAATQVWCATSPRLAGMGGVYCENSNIAPVRSVGGKTVFSVGDSLHEGGVWPFAIDRDAAAKLWSVSEQMVGLHFAI
jgi:NAD(P)-dependent dehydrogenase (short-subunit alcohol dehydrogenase family)